MDFSKLLLVACFGGAAVWISWRVSVRNATAIEEPLWVDLGRTVALIFFVVLVVRSFIVEPYKIPSESMLPTLQKGDFIFVKKYSYGLRLPVVHTQLIPTGLPRYGDVVVFRQPGQESIHYIKRVVGLPGDRLSYKNRRLNINGIPIQSQNISHDYHDFGSNIELSVESIGNVQHKILHHRVSVPGTIEWFEKTVPRGHYFVMGDNRDNSQDSRYANVGFVPQANLVGKAAMVWLNSGRWDRVGNKIQ